MTISPETPAPTVVVVGIGAGGWGDLPPESKDAVAAAEVVLGGDRHLAMVPLGDVRKLSWPRPFRAGLRSLLDEWHGRRITVLASGDPFVSGVGTTIVEMLGTDAVRVLPAVSSVALARARLGWPAESCVSVSVVGRNVHRVSRLLTPGARILVLSSDASTPAELAALVRERGYGRSRMRVLADLGSASERITTGAAEDWAEPPGSALNIVAIECAPDAGTVALPTAPGLPDEVFEHDGQLTKREVRAMALARLTPLPGQLLWDVGAGSGSVAIEWIRSHEANRAVAIESDPTRAERIARNAERLGAPALRVLRGVAPDVLADGELREQPDAVFLGGGVSRQGLIETCVDALGPGGRLVAHGVTIETETALAVAHQEYGGELIRLSVERAAPLGGFTGWQPARTLTQWSLTKEYV